MNDQTVEQEIQSKGLNAPRLNPQHIKDTILTEQFHVFPGTTVTVCCLTLKNGFNTVGHAAAVSPENFDRAIGERVARDNAVREIWALEGYLLKDRLAAARTVIGADRD